MSHQFIFICPSCKKEDAVSKTSCTSCGTRFYFKSDRVIINKKSWTYPELFKWMRETISVNYTNLDTWRCLNDSKFSIKDKIIRVSQAADLKQGIVQKKFTGYRKMFCRNIEKPVIIAKGQLLLGENEFYFKSNSKLYRFRYHDLTCVTTNGHYFEFKVKKQPFYQIRFHRESPLKYEIIFQKILSAIYDPAKIVEFQPRMRIYEPTCHTIPLSIKSTESVQTGLLENLIKKILLLLLKIFFMVMGPITVKGRENLIEQPPFITLVNHQSTFDPLIILTFLDNRLAFLTKSTSFLRWFEKIFLKIGRCIPTTRYQNDPIVIYHILKAFNHGIPVGIFPEGERSWDGEMQHFKMGVIRLLVNLRLPIVPIILKNAFYFMPRWRVFPRRQRMEIIVKPPFCLIPDVYNCKDLQNFLENIFKEEIQKF